MAWMGRAEVLHDVRQWFPLQPDRYAPPEHAGFLHQPVRRGMQALSGNHQGKPHLSGAASLQKAEQCEFGLFPVQPVQVNDPFRIELAGFQPPLDLAVDVSGTFAGGGCVSCPE